MLALLECSVYIRYIVLTLNNGAIILLKVYITIHLQI